MADGTIHGESHLAAQYTGLSPAGSLTGQDSNLRPTVLETVALPAELPAYGRNPRIAPHDVPGINTLSGIPRYGMRSVRIEAMMLVFHAHLLHGGLFMCPMPSDLMPG